MPGLLAITRNLSVVPLLDISNPEFAKQYGLGVWWGMYGDEQGKGLYPDSYLIENISRNLHAGHYDDISSPWFHFVGFYLGMIHGGMIDPSTFRLRPSETMVILTDPDFINGYQSGQQEALPLTDTLFMESLNSYALTHLSTQKLAYELGRWIGNLSLALKPVMLPATAS